MSYMHIDNLYKNIDILQFRECYAMEKIHGTSAHISWKPLSECPPEGVYGPAPVWKLSFFAGGVNQANFEHLFDQEVLRKGFWSLDAKAQATVYGEAYGGKCQGMSKTYGDKLRFVAFEVKIGDSWLAVPQAEEVCKKLGLEFVHYNKIPTTMEAIDAERDADSVQAVRNGMGPGKMREGIVLRPLFEVVKNNGARVIAKHKRAEFCETATHRDVSAEQVKALKDADAITAEWVTEMRLTHVLDAFPDADITKTGDIIKAMAEDIMREAAGEIVDSKPVRAAIGKTTAQMFKKRLQSCLYKEGK